MMNERVSRRVFCFRSPSRPPDFTFRRVIGIRTGISRPRRGFQLVPLARSDMFLFRMYSIRNTCSGYVANVGRVVMNSLSAPALCPR